MTLWCPAPINNITPAPPAQGSYRKKGWRDIKSQRNGRFVVRVLSPRNIRSYIPLSLTEHGRLNKTRTRVVPADANMEGASLVGPGQRTIGSQGRLSMGEIAFPGQES